MLQCGINRSRNPHLAIKHLGIRFGTKAEVAGVWCFQIALRACGKVDIQDEHTEPSQNGIIRSAELAHPAGLMFSAHNKYSLPDKHLRPRFIRRQRARFGKTFGLLEGKYRVDLLPCTMPIAIKVNVYDIFCYSLQFFD